MFLKGGGRIEGLCVEVLTRSAGRESLHSFFKAPVAFEAPAIPARSFMVLTVNAPYVCESKECLSQ